jgi:ParB family chromosome partitioning protein
VVIEDNVRTAADLDAAFLASVKRHGVLLPTIG